MHELTCLDGNKQMKHTNNTYVLELDKISSEYENILIKFKDEQVHQKVIIKNPYSKLCGVGLLGNTTSIDASSNVKKSYNAWKAMIHRCYSEKEHKRAPTYQNCSVCKEWLYYSNFEQWWDDNYYEINNQEMHLDKDILIKGNKVYSPQTCTIVPQDINSLLIKRDSKRGNLPIGVTYFKRDKKYMATICKFGKQHYLGLYNTPEEAFQAYKQEKERHIKEVAEKYKDKIPKKLYDAMYKWEIEITD